jgi:hypothetical protein
MKRIRKSQFVMCFAAALWMVCGVARAATPTEDAEEKVFIGYVPGTAENIRYEWYTHLSMPL